MRKYRILALMFSLMLVAAACSESTGSDTTSAADTTAATEDAAHETGEEADPDEGEEAHEDDDGDENEEAVEDDDGHDEGEEAHEEDGHDDMDMDMDMSGDNIPEADGDVTSEYTVILSEFGFDPSELDLTPGETVRFILINEGALVHEFRLTTEHKAGEHVAAGHEDHDAEGGEGDEGHHEEDADIIVNVAGGETRTVEMTLPSDADALDQVACLIPGHYEAGMFASIDF